MSYSSDDSRIKAVLYSDSNASGHFVYSIEGHSRYCRPDCNYINPTNGPILIFESSKEAAAKGLKACSICQPDLEVRVAPGVIDSTVDAVNASLGLDVSTSSSLTLDHSNRLPPGSSNQNETVRAPISYVDQENILVLTDGPPLVVGSKYEHHRSASTTGSPIPQSELESQGWRPRRASIANGHIPAATAAVAEISETNSIKREGKQQREEKHREGDHIRLVDEACRHIAAAAAAAVAVAAANAPQSVTSDNDSSKYRSRSNSTATTGSQSKLQRKKRRGGILGFKELAAKAGLSPWHFHRVFRSVTGLTPKAYGEACWNAVTLNLSVSNSVLVSKPCDSPPPSKVAKQQYGKNTGNNKNFNSNRSNENSNGSVLAGPRRNHITIPTTTTSDSNSHISSSTSTPSFSIIDTPRGVSSSQPLDILHDMFNGSSHHTSGLVTSSSSTPAGSMSTPVGRASNSPFSSFPSTSMGYSGTSLVDAVSSRSVHDMSPLNFDANISTHVPDLLHSQNHLPQEVPWVSIDDSVSMALENGGIPATTCEQMASTGLMSTTPIAPITQGMSHLYTSTGMDSFSTNVPTSESNLDPYQFMTDGSWMSGTPVPTTDSEIRQDANGDPMTAVIREWIDTTSS